MGTQAYLIQLHTASICLLAFYHKAFPKASSLLSWHLAICLCSGEYLPVKTALSPGDKGPLPPLYISQRSGKNLVLLAYNSNFNINRYMALLPFLYFSPCFFTLVSWDYLHQNPCLEPAVLGSQIRTLYPIKHLNYV